MGNLTERGCFIAPANEPAAKPSVPSGTGSAIAKNRVTFGRRRTSCMNVAFGILAACFLAGCSDATPEKPAAEVKPAAPSVPDDIQSAADSLLGKETTGLLFGHLARNVQQQFLAANVVPKPPKNTLPGTIVTRAVVADSAKTHGS